MVENFHNKKIKILRTDKGWEYCSTDFENYLKQASEEQQSLRTTQASDEKQSPRAPQASEVKRSPRTTHASDEMVSPPSTQDSPHQLSVLNITFGHLPRPVCHITITIIFSMNYLHLYFENKK